MLLFRGFLYLRSTRVACYLNTSRLFVASQKYYATKTDEEEEDNKPIKYSATPASRWQAQFSRTGVQDTRPWYEPYVILTCVVVFLVYFCVLREENDIDIELGKSLYTRIDGLEENQLQLILAYNEEKGLPVKEIIDRLNEIEAVKNQQL